MNITKNDVTKYQKLCKEKLGKDVDYQAAFKELSQLVRQMEVVYQPITKKQLQDLKERDTEKNQ